MPTQWFCVLFNGGVTLYKRLLNVVVEFRVRLYVLVSNLHFLILAHITKFPDREVLGSPFVLKYRFHKIK